MTYVMHIFLLCVTYVIRSYSFKKKDLVTYMMRIPFSLSDINSKIFFNNIL